MWKGSSGVENITTGNHWNTVYTVLTWQEWLYLLKERLAKFLDGVKQFLTFTFLSPNLTIKSFELSSSRHGAVEDGSDERLQPWEGMGYGTHAGTGKSLLPFC